jgi:hypothetical protein
VRRQRAPLHETMGERIVDESDGGRHACTVQFCFSRELTGVAVNDRSAKCAAINNPHIGEIGPSGDCKRCKLRS